MNDNEFFSFTVDITDDVPPPRSGSFGEMPKRMPLGVKLVALWNLLFGLVVGVPVVLLMALLGDDFGAGAAIIGGLLFACAHTAASAVSFKRYKRKFDASARQFALLCVLPLLVLGGVLFAMAWWVVDGLDAFVFAIIGLCYGGYSVVYGVLLSVVLGIMHAARPR